MNNPYMAAKMEVAKAGLGLCAEEEKRFFERLEGLYWQGFKAGLSVKLIDTTLYHTINRLMAILGCEGEINTDANAVHEVMGALKNIDGGVYQDAPAVAPNEVMQQRDALLVLANQYASECANCGGTGLVTIMDYDGRGSDADDQPCRECADIRLTIAAAGGAQ